jgi:tRNA pseudouridine38-40 synthase
MARYQVILAYDGTAFAGFQRQVNRRTVQGVVEEALHALGWPGKSILSAGRTDTGVHALGQVIAFDLDWTHGTDALAAALNNRLPEDVAVRRVYPAQADFHPRYAALARHYRYRVLVDEIRNPLAERYAWRIWPAPDVELLEQAAAWLQGAFDFAAFGAPPKAGGSTTRTVYRAGWQTDGQEIRFEIVGNAFLYRMVRRLVAFQLAIGWGKTSLDELRKHLVTPGDTSWAGLAPAHGLTLYAVYYAGQTGEEKYLENLEIGRK